MDERIERQRKPRKCPSCGQATVATVFYGLPDFNDEFERKLDAGEITIGGCISEPYIDPAWHCTHCDADIYRRLSAETS